MRRRALILLALLLCAAAPGLVFPGKGKKQDPDAKESGKPKIRLVAEPAVGFLPVTTILTAHLNGVPPRDTGFCHPAVTWVRINPGQREENASRYHADAACRHPPEEALAVTSFTRVLTLENPGSYLFKIILETSDGRRVESVYTRVEVLRVQ